MEAYIYNSFAFLSCRNSLRGAAVCAFKFSDIISSFEGLYKEQRTALSNWLPVRESDVPEPHPGKVSPRTFINLYLF